MAQRDLQRVERAATKVRRSEGTLREARGELRSAIVTARQAGETLTAIARVLGVSRQRVKQLLD